MSETFVEYNNAARIMLDDKVILVALKALVKIMIEDRSGYNFQLQHFSSMTGQHLFDWISQQYLYRGSARRFHLLASIGFVIFLRVGEQFERKVSQKSPNKEVAFHMVQVDIAIQDRI